jgi:hypothetical protein
MTDIAKKLKEWFHSKWISWATVAMSVIASTVISSTASYFVTTWTDATKRKLDVSDAQTRSLLDAMVQFQTFAASFASELSETKQVSPETRRRLVENLNEQYARAKFVDNLLPPSKVEVAANYRDQVVKMIESVHSTNDMTDMSKFWSNAARLTVARNRLNDAIRSTL